MANIPRGEAVGTRACPYGHRSVEVYETTFRCKVCYKYHNRDPGYDKDELVDLRAEEPPLADSPDDRSELDRLRAEMEGSV